jgi:hypothetical protein
MIGSFVGLLFVRLWGASGDYWRGLGGRTVSARVHVGCMACNRLPTKAPLRKHNKPSCRMYCSDSPLRSVGEACLGTRLASRTRRYLCDGVCSLAMGLMPRLLSAHDCPMALVALLETPPWVRHRGPRRRMERWQDNTWQVVEPGDRLKLGQADAQVCVCVCVWWWWGYGIPRLLQFSVQIMHFCLPVLLYVCDGVHVTRET